MVLVEQSAIALRFRGSVHAATGAIIKAYCIMNVNIPFMGLLQDISIPRQVDV